MSEPDEITLDAEEQTLVRVLAALRNGNNLVNSVKSAKMSPRGDYEVNLDGMGGEYAFGKMKNLFPTSALAPVREDMTSLTARGTRWT